eukprot:10705347-Heterocapsa_arctica.AAC.1
MNEKPWRLYEWACEPNSLLSKWFDDAGHSAVRLYLPAHDLRDRKCTSRFVWDIVENHKKGFLIVIWIALPCTPWSRWQR